MVVCLSVFACRRLNSGALCYGGFSDKNKICTMTCTTTLLFLRYILEVYVNTHTKSCLLV